MGQVAFSTDFLKPYLPAWVTIGIFILPAALVIFVTADEASGRLVMGCHVFGASWYVLITICAEVISFLGAAPKNATLFRILMHLGWLHFAPILGRFVRALIDEKR